MRNVDNRINQAPTKRLLSAASAILLLGATLSAPPSSANDIVMHPAGCQAPFLSQAGPMRWHENYLMNPVGNISTFVICPLTFDPDVVNFPAAGTTNVRVDGAVQSGAAPQAPQCFFASADRENLKLDPYINIPGGDRTFITPLGTNLTFPRWFASVPVSNDAITAATGGANPAFRNAAVFCQLPPGYAISTIMLQQ